LLQWIITLIVLTLGKSGSMAFHNGRVYNQPALEIEKVIDTTGCGDAFQAAFTAEYYISGDIDAALLCGAESGKDTAAQIGGN
jgi:sugar/nucleoside kinase (ribokinase family)